MDKLPRGVSLTAQGRFQARIYRNGGSVHLGVFDDVEEAAAAYRAARETSRTVGTRADSSVAGGFAIEQSREQSRFSVSAPLPIEMPAVMPQSKPQAVAAAVRARPIVVPPGCCPNCTSTLYGVVGSSDDVKRCRQCGYQQRRVEIDEHGHRVFSRAEQVFSVAGISRRQLDDESWMDLHVKGRGVLA